MQSEETSLRRNRDADERAEVILGIGLSLPHMFSRNGRTFGADVAFQSQVLVRDLLKLGIFSMQIHSMANIEDADGNIPVSFARVPASLLGVGMHYAISVAPTDADTSDEMGVPVISLDALDLHIQKLEQNFSNIVVDMDLIARISRLSRDQALAPMPLGATATERV